MLRVETSEFQHADPFEEGKDHIPSACIAAELEVNFEVWNDAVDLVCDDLALGGAVCMDMTGETGLPGCVCVRR